MKEDFIVPVYIEPDVSALLTVGPSASSSGVHLVYLTGISCGPQPAINHVSGFKTSISGLLDHNPPV